MDASMDAAPPPPPEQESMVRPLVYGVVGAGLLLNLAGLLIANPSFGIGTVLLALLIAAPYLLYARLAIARPGAEAIVGGVLLLAIAVWGSMSAIGGGRDDTGTFVQLAASLVLVELVVFAAGVLLRPPSAGRPQRRQRHGRAR